MTKRNISTLIEKSPNKKLRTEKKFLKGKKRCLI